ncbi:hypothetical protein DIPPA_18210 [Diplonema papillatum]|nr:hypothetical protein DIPPA_18210 [Diplonema papillatum]
MLAPGHAPELLATGCLKPGEMGVVVLPPEVDTTDQEGTLSITVRGPRGDSFVYFKDDLMLLNTENGHASAVGSRNDAISLELDQLRTAKAAAVAAEEFEQARNLKTRIDRLVEHQRRTNERLTHVREQIKFTAQLKDDAAAHENYAEAARLKADLQRLRAEEQQLSAEMGPPHHSDSKSHTSYRHMSVPELTDAFRKGMSHIRSSAGLVSIAEALHDASPAALYSIIAEFQPSLSTGKIQRNWRKIVEIYVAHAEKALVTQGSQVSGSERGELAVYSESYIPYGEVASQIKGVISFLDSPLSPRTLKEVRHLRKTGSSSF